MAIKIRCSRCSKRISIDEAFAGGVCRCPYCTAINHVSLHGEPVAEASKPRAAAAPAGKAQNVPFADRVPFQGIAAIAMIGILLAMIVAGIVIAVQLRRGDHGGSGNGGPGGNSGPIVPGGPGNPFLSAAQPAVAGDLSVAPPVVYVINADLEMEKVYGFVLRMIRASAASLKDGPAGVVVSSEAGAVVVSGGLMSASAASAALPPAEAVRWAWSVDPTAGLAAAMDLNPSTVVLFACAWTGGDDIVARAKGQGVRIVTVAPGAAGTIGADLARLAEATGGGSRAMTIRQLRDFAADAPTGQ